MYLLKFYYTCSTDIRAIDTGSGEATLSKLLASLSKRGSTLKGKNLLQFWSKFFPFRVDPFPEEPFQMFVGVQESNQEVGKIFLSELARNVDTTSLQHRCNMLDATLYKRHVPAGLCTKCGKFTKCIPRPITIILTYKKIDYSGFFFSFVTEPETAS